MAILTMLSVSPGKAQTATKALDPEFLRLRPVPPPGGFKPEPSGYAKPKFYADLEKRTSQPFRLQEIPKDDKCVTVSFGIAREGTVYNCKVARSSGDPLFDLGAVESLLNLAPFAHPPSENSSDLVEAEVTIDSAKNCQQGVGAIDFFGRNPSLKGKIILFHRIPFSVLYSYPGSFTKDELDASKNLSLYNAENTEQHLLTRLKCFYSNWQIYIQEHKYATKEDLIEQARIMERRFGGLFFLKELSKLDKAVEHLKQI